MPHRGRFMELPGSILPGKWQALVVDEPTPEDDTTDDDSLNSLRISFRHDGTPSTQLEAYYTGQEATPDGSVISLINPSINRVSMFVKQGMSLSVDLGTNKSFYRRIASSLDCFMDVATHLVLQVFSVTTRLTFASKARIR